MKKSKLNFFKIPTPQAVCFNCFILMCLLTSSATAATIELDLDGIEDLGTAAQYEVWLLESGTAFSAGVFMVNASGELSQSQFTVSDELAIAADTVMVSIESIPDTDPTPSDSRLLAGNLINNTADISIGHPAAIADDLSGVVGQLTLLNPTGSKGSSFENGIWYVDGLVTLEAGLELAPLPTGWVYEGWVTDLTVNQHLSTGTFLVADEADSDGAGATAGVGPALPFPGQDYNNPVRDLSNNHRAFISIEPVPDNSPEPFTIRVLQHDIVDSLVAQSLANTALATSPQGQVLINLGTGPVAPQQVPAVSWVFMILLFVWIGIISQTKLLNGK